MLGMRKRERDGSGMAPRDERMLSNLSWEADVVLLERRSRLIAWRLAAAEAVVICLMAISLVMLIPLKTVVPHVVMVDKLTGEGQVVAPARDYVETSALSDKHWIQAFVVARERYVYKIIQHDYDTVRRLADDKTWANYTPLFEGSEALDKRYKDDVEIIPSVLSITLSGNGLATVRYEIRTRDYRTSAPPVTTRRIATLRYEYAVKNLVLEKEAIANPLGFTVTSYQTDPEMGGDSKAAAR